MKTALLMSLSALTLSLVATPTFAKEVVSQNNRASTSNSSIVEITPFDLVYGAYQGDFTNSGIPGYSKFITAVKARKIEAEDLVKEAISRGRLASETIDDRGYISSVNGLMRTIEED